jgi:hypothetical protein
MDQIDPDVHGPCRSTFLARRATINLRFHIPFWKFMGELVAVNVAIALLANTRPMASQQG